MMGGVRIRVTVGVWHVLLRSRVQDPLAHLRVKVRFGLCIVRVKVRVRMKIGLKKIFFSSSSLLVSKQEATKP
jgi:hypothetical protein